MTNAGGYGRLHESLVRNAARRVESNKAWNDSRPCEAPCNGGGEASYNSQGQPRIVLLEVAASGRVEPRRVKLRVSTRPISHSCHNHRVASGYESHLGDSTKSSYEAARQCKQKRRLCVKLIRQVGPPQSRRRGIFQSYHRCATRACNAARQRDYERCNIAGTSAKRRGGPQRCRACARRLLDCCFLQHCSK